MHIQWTNTQELKKWTINTYNTDEPQKHSAKCEMPTTKNHTVIPFIWKDETIETEIRSVLPDSWDESGIDCKWTGGKFKVMELFWNWL